MCSLNIIIVIITITIVIIIIITVIIMIIILLLSLLSWQIGEAFFRLVKVFPLHILHILYIVKQFAWCPGSLKLTQLLL